MKDTLTGRDILQAVADLGPPLPKYVLHVGSMNELKRAVPAIAGALSGLDALAAIPIFLDETLAPEIVELREGDRVMVRVNLRLDALRRVMAGQR